ncbi:MAG: hypothetical protein IPM86_01185 [Saprospiraceae bacterium]|nr:hypothetical protein [Saprospiraceae bacterium]
MRWKQILLALTWIFSLEYGAAQWHNQTLYPNDSGLILITKLVNDFKPSIVLDYSPARVKMYTEIYNEADTVRCVYTKHALYVNHLSQDAIADLYKMEIQMASHVSIHFHRAWVLKQEMQDQTCIISIQVEQP